jgi:hypothetical protein
LLSLGLLEEAIWMAGKDIDKYPQLSSSESSYNDMFKKWNANKEDDKVRLDTLTSLREWRRKMLDLYYF